MKKNTISEATHAVIAVREAKQALTVLEYKAKRAELLSGSYSVGCDEYSGQFFTLDKRPEAVLESPNSFEQDSLHKLPNGDWLEILQGSKSFARHTYDLAYALDRARRRQIGGYVLRADVAAACRAVIEAGAAQLAGYVIWNYYEFKDGECSHPSHSFERSLRADEQAARWVECLHEARERHQAPEQHAAIIRAIELLSKPDALREYPAPIDSPLCSLIKELEEQVEED